MFHLRRKSPRHRRRHAHDRKTAHKHQDPQYGPHTARSETCRVKHCWQSRLRSTSPAGVFVPIVEGLSRDADSTAKEHNREFSGADKLIGFPCGEAKQVPDIVRLQGSDSFVFLIHVKSPFLSDLCRLPCDSAKVVLLL